VIFVIHLITRYMCEFDMIVYCRIIEHVVHPLIFILHLCYLMYVTCSSESGYKSKAKEKIGGFPHMV
jgi:hypothetical protein